jgi:hypothetical protein
VNPGVGIPAVKESVPVSFENFGAPTQSEKTESDALVETISRRSFGNRTTISALFTATAFVSTRISTLIVSPVIIPDDGLKYEVAAKAFSVLKNPKTMSIAPMMLFEKKNGTCCGFL